MARSRTLARWVVHLVPAAVLGMVMAGQYDDGIIRLVFVAVPVAAMIVSLVRTTEALPGSIAEISPAPATIRSNRFPDALSA